MMLNQLEQVLDWNTGAWKKVAEILGDGTQTETELMLVKTLCLMGEQINRDFLVNVTKAKEILLDAYSDLPDADELQDMALPVNKDEAIKRLKEAVQTMATVVREILVQITGVLGTGGILVDQELNKKEKLNETKGLFEDSGE